MSKTIEQWQSEIESIGTARLKSLKESLTQLEQWEEFKKEYKWTGLFTLGRMIDYELNQRG